MRPLGLDENEGKLYVINNAYEKGGERIEIFKIEGTENNLSLLYERSLLFPESFMGLLNDVIAISENEIITTTWLNFPDAIEGRTAGGFKSFLKRLYYLIAKIPNTAAFYCTFERNNI